MNKKLKIFLTIVGTALFVLTFLWLASFAFRLFMSGGSEGFLRSLITGKFTLNTQVRSYPQDIIFYQMHYGDTHEGKLKAAWWFSVVIHFCVILLISKIMTKKPKLYGDARFAHIGEIQKAALFIPASDVKNGGLFAGTRIVVGRIGRRYIGLGGQLFAMLLAPTRSGKGVAVVVPVLLSYAHSVVVSDIKQELFRITAAFRHKCGQEVHLFNPFDPEGRTARWNPLSYVSRSEALRVDDLSQIAICLIPDSGGDDSFFEESARKLFIGLGLYCLDKERFFRQHNAPAFVPTVKEILNLATVFSGEAIGYFTSLMQDEFVEPITLQTINSAVSAGDKTFASILATLTANLSPWLSQPVSDATSGDDFDLRDVRRKPMTIYIGIQPKDLQKASKIINLFYSQLMNENTSVQPEENPELKYQCLMLMDEGTAAGRISILEKAVSYMAGYNLRLLFVAQSPSQLENRKVYGEHSSRTIMTNIALKILYKPGDRKDSEEYSSLLGKVTVKEDTSRSRGGGSRGTSVTETQNQRDLMMPQELREMSNAKEIILYEGISHPIMADKIRYYEDRVFIPNFQKQGKVRMPRMKDRLEANEYYAPLANQFIRDAKQKYSKLLEEGVEATIIESGVRTAVIGNFIGNIIESNSTDEKASRQAA